MSSWPSAKARRVFAALRQIGWRHDRTVGSHKIMKKDGWPDSSILVPRFRRTWTSHPLKISKKTGLQPQDPLTARPTCLLRWRIGDSTVTMKTKHIADLLLENRGTVKWGWISDGMDRARANQFLLGSILNYQMRAGRIDSIVTGFVETHIKDPSLLWEKITSIPREDWNLKFHEYHLHRFPKAHD
jgi:predicted RNA binding protein YcfA (HicA-like mRNA interferase family)